MLRKLPYLLLSLVVVLLFSIFSPKETSAISLKDIPAKYKTEIDYLVNKNLIAGYPGGYFYPDRSVTREEAATIIGRTIGLNGAQRQTSFTDVNSSSFGSGYIQSAYEKGIISGHGEGIFHPKNPITRGEMAYLIASAFNLTEKSEIYFNDVATSGTLFEAINKVATAGITVGYPDGTFGPNKSITRAEFSVFVARSLNPDFKVNVQPKPTGERIVSASTLNVRSGPGASFNQVGVLANGSKVTTYQYVGDWVYISYGTIQGYVNSNYLKGTSTPNVGANVIAIDPGHGGSDPGAMANGLKEKEINLDVSLRIKKYLEDAGIKVVMTRTNDTFISLDGRVDYAVKNGADTFVSIHTNSATASSASGTETYYSAAALNPRAESSKQLATFIQKRLLEAWGTTDRGVKEAGFRVIKANPLPATLVELGFITNSGDANKLGSNEYRESAAKAISLGIQDYYNWKNR
ncbi:N-acetylmuramoyl-L-alanine amidase [Peribacillus loiseleuriae]|uniref:N-acetylmuramoyl-L-alanine amidase n=1 Tax=Peribacillus loiseleuriae TaxID=1679170 RepID=A0A0K9GYW5_9BACI|nr:N-acetylmuramoyl-L-alanine amidase [Peribacillus loiseleuriae]KMY51919.1 hypothetical protein AC625_22300 [Peribacillus loiseleuriae]